jgi:hypothetical protein
MSAIADSDRARWTAIRLLRWYPRPWRMRYEREMLALLDEIPVRWRQVGNIAATALREWMSPRALGWPARSAAGRIQMVRLLSFLIFAYAIDGVARVIAARMISGHIAISDEFDTWATVLMAVPLLRVMQAGVLRLKRVQRSRWAGPIQRHPWLQYLSSWGSPGPAVAPPSDVRDASRRAPPAVGDGHHVGHQAVHECLSRLDVHASPGPANQHIPANSQGPIRIHEPAESLAGAHTELLAMTPHAGSERARRTAIRLLEWYPRPWRMRYEREMRALVEDMPVGWKQVGNLAITGVREWMSPRALGWPARSAAGRLWKRRFLTFLACAYSLDTVARVIGARVISAGVEITWPLETAVTLIVVGSGHPRVHPFRAPAEQASLGCPCAAARLVNLDPRMGSCPVGPPDVADVGVVLRANGFGLPQLDHAPTPALRPCLACLRMDVYHVRAIRSHAAPEPHSGVAPDARAAARSDCRRHMSTNAGSNRARRTTIRLLRWYPRPWRVRYEREMRALLGRHAVGGSRSAISRSPAFANGFRRARFGWPAAVRGRSLLSAISNY